MRSIIVGLPLRLPHVQQLPYVVHAPVDDPNSAIQQVLTEQEQDRRPEFVDAQSEYVEYGKGTTGRYNGFGVTQ